MAMVRVRDLWKSRAGAAKAPSAAITPGRLADVLQHRLGPVDREGQDRVLPVDLDEGDVEQLVEAVHHEQPGDDHRRRHRDAERGEGRAERPAADGAQDHHRRLARFEEADHPVEDALAEVGRAPGGCIATAGLRPTTRRTAKAAPSIAAPSPVAAEVA